MGRMKAAEQKVFDRNWDKFVQEFKQVRRTGDVSRKDKEQLIIKYNLITTNGLITYKKLCDILLKRKIMTDRDYKTTLILRGFLFSSRHNERAHVVSILANRFNVDCNSINARLRNLGLRQRIAKKTETWQAAAKEMFKKGDSYKTISKQVKKPTTLVIAFFRYDSGLKLSSDYGVRGIQISYRNLQAKTIENSHLEGFIWADGTVQAGNEVAISICVDDQDYLNELASGLVTSGQGPKVSIIKTKFTSDRYSYKDRVGLTIARKSYANYLQSLGLPQNKEKSEFGFPDYILKDTKNFWAFLRGFFEGDGTITKEQIGICVNLKQANDLNTLLIKFFGFSGNIIPDKSIYRLSFGGLPQVMFLLAGMYSARGICMARKMRISKECWNKNKKNYGITLDFEELPLISREQLRSKVFRSLQKKMKALKYNIVAKNIHTGETFTGLKSDLVSKLDTKTTYVTRAEKGQRKSVCGWRIMISEKYS
jgi:DNA-binding transcriptional regulator WhiA